MKNLLFVKSSLSGAESKSVAVARDLVKQLRAKHGALKVYERDVADGSVPHLTGEFLAAAFTPAEKRDERQHAVAKAGDVLLEELEAADLIVMAAPMYNFTISSTLHAWFDHVTRAGRTFRYTAEGRPEGLLKNKKVYVVTARGGFYTGDSPARELDFQEPYLRAMLAFNGLTDVTFVHVEGQKISPEVAENGVRRARQEIEKLVPMASAA